jgi:A/G-specific adenine glycosylase
MASQKTFSSTLLNWHNTENQRVLPWKGEKNIYKIWLSEIILQQTRAAQGLPYYNAFIKNYPTVLHLANAKDEAVFKLWEGLGYYSRCRNLLFTARLIRDDFNGVFPNTHQGLLALKGIGPYTAAAIASFGYNIPVAVVDGNVVRVLARVFGQYDVFNTTIGKTNFNALATKCFAINEPAKYNQAIMDFGATVCKPKQPLCKSCPLQKYCYAFKNEKQIMLPTKANKLVLKNRFFNYVIATHKGKYIIKQRTQKDIWNELYEFILIENIKEINEAEILAAIKKQHKITAKTLGNTVVQKLTHQKITLRFFAGEASKVPVGFITVSKTELKKYGFPVSLKNAIEAFVH